MNLLAIDPGDVYSGVALIDVDTCRPLIVEKISNEELRDKLLDAAYGPLDAVRIEMISSYGMAVGAEVFDTCVWIGRFLEITPCDDVQLVFRRAVKLHHCGNTAAKDPNIIQALVDRFARGQKNKGKGTKAEPGWFYGFKEDIWQAYALAVQGADVLRARQWVA